MAATSDSQRRNRLIAAFILVVTLFLVAQTAVVVEQQRRTLMKTSHHHMQSELELVAQTIKEAALRHDLAQVYLLLELWGQKQPQVASVTARAVNGAMLGQFKRPTDPDAPIQRHFASVKVDDEPIVFLTLEHNGQQLAHEALKLALTTALSEGVFMALLGAALWLLIHAVGIRPMEREILARKRIEQALKVSQENLTLAQKIAHMGSWEWDPERHTLHWSDEMRRMLGVERQPSINSVICLLEYCREPDRARLDQRLSGLIAGVRDSFHLEHAIWTTRGERLFVEHRAERWRSNVDGGVVIRGVLLNVTNSALLRESLRASEQKYRNLFASMSSGVAVYEVVDDGDDFIFRDLNAAGERFSQVTLDEVVGKRLTELFPGVREMGLLDTLKEVWITGQPKHHPLTHYQDNRVHQWVENYVFKLDDGQVVAVYDDVTEMKQAQHSLKKSEERFALAIRGSADGLWDWDIIHNDVYLSPRWKEMLGYADDELENHIDTWRNLVHPDDMPQVEQVLEQLFTGQECAYQCEFRMRHKSERYIDILARGLLKRDADGQPERMVGTHTDLTERKRNVRALADSNQRLKLATQAGGIGVWEWDVRSGVISWDQRMREIYQLTETGKQLNHAWRNAVHPDDRHDLAQRLKQCLHGGLEFAGEFRILWPNGGERTVSAAAVVERDAEGQPLRMIGVNWDITRQKTQERIIMDAVRQAEKANRAKTEFLAHMSHEIRTPLNSVIGMAELLADGTNLTAEQNQQLRVINRAGNNLLAIINDVLDLSKIEAGELVLEQSDFSVRALVHGVVEILARQAQNKGVTLTCEIAKQTPDHAHGDAQRLRQVLLNLLGNAVKFTEKGGVSVRAEPAPESPGWLTLHVIDNGIGIAAEHLESIFTPFTQADISTTRRFGGTGLGLSICRQLVSLMGGRIEVQSVMGEGSQFSVTLPVLLSKTPATHAEPSEPGQAHPMAAQTHTGLNILVADDSEDNLLLAQTLLRRAGHQCICVASGDEAVNWSAQQPFDLILMDIQMPGMDGYEATQQIRLREQRNALPHTPIIALTAFAMKEDRVRALAAGCDLHLTKPIRRNQLLEAINQALDAEHSPEGDSD
ncbi:PAS domain-containing hybrid sensor histidine kinase/response regulator [Magnetofaba australis]|uniref:histidine kinase n=1 Tax=Magnetofaba australis IT-1 TaxID=1434232 RepID=A0A1Y2K098_9PROT|nr:PAS domain-containing protein [Magnetofaba australis]OSM00224.1 putative PAS/PAC sensor hybrid histidine kinase [Magnetofaba australis IT-1]